jgi:hypothetical protein
MQHNELKNPHLSVDNHRMCAILVLEDRRDAMEEMQDLARRLSEGSYPRYHMDAYGRTWREGAKGEAWELQDMEGTK